jgi:hypothetical protein
MLKKKSPGATSSQSQNPCMATMSASRLEVYVELSGQKICQNDKLPSVVRANIKSIHSFGCLFLSISMNS